MTARVTSSASVSVGAIPILGRSGHQWGWSFNRSSMVTYSRVARASRSAFIAVSSKSRLFPLIMGAFARQVVDTGIRSR